MREWKSEPPLFHRTLPEARWSYAPVPMKGFKRKRTWKPKKELDAQPS
jgi:hypothetical protein